MVAPPNGLLPTDIREVLKTKRLARRIYYLPEVDSTNRIAAELARAGEADGTLVIADYQWEGRGRHGRRWESPPASNLLFTLILRPRVPPDAVLSITLALSLRIAESLSGVAGEALGVKWPNDVVASRGKICGILSESSSASGRTLYVNVGVGINVNAGPADLDGRGAPAASLRSLANSTLERRRVLADVLAAMEEGYSEFSRAGFGVFVDAYNDRLTLRGQQVGYSMKGRERVGMVRTVRDDGGLIVRQADGRDVVLFEPEVTRL